MPVVSVILILLLVVLVLLLAPFALQLSLRWLSTPPRAGSLSVVRDEDGENAKVADPRAETVHHGLAKHPSARLIG